MKINYYNLRHLFLIPSLLILPLYLNAFNGHVGFNKNITDVEWNFLPNTNSSFKYSESADAEFFIYHKNYGLKFNSSSFNLDLERSIHPKELELNAESNEVEFFYIKEDQTSSYSLAFKEQVADPQIIDCYTFSSLTIGTCADAQITLSNSKPKYNFLGDSLLWIAGENKSIRSSFIKATNNSLVDEYSFFLELTENQFNWISPIEEITTGFVANLSFNGSRIGDLVTGTIVTLPQRDKWLTVVGGFSINKSIPIVNNFFFFYEPTLVLVKQIDYRNINDIPTYNLKIISGINYNYLNFDISLFATYYHKNLYGFEHIAFNQRSEHHYDSNYGSIGISGYYKF
jgi:hypothetical protein|tara:strand:- start:298 stop:1326 length:1029 start_codon:yes stop_codon:yes gene_type:complete